MHGLYQTYKTIFLVESKNIGQYVAAMRRYFEPSYVPIKRPVCANKPSDSVSKVVGDFLLDEIYP